MTGNTFQSQVLSAVHDAIAVVDESMCVTFWNKAAEEITGWSAEETVSVSGEHISHRLGADSFWQESTARLSEAGLFDTEITALRKDGSPLVLDVHMKRICAPDGEFAGAVYTFQDITGRKHTEEALRHAAEELKNKEQEALEIIDGFSEGSWIVDRLKRTIQCSEKWAKRIGLDHVPEEERLAYTNSLSHPDDTAGGNSIWHCMEAGMTRFDLEYRVKTVDSGYIWTQNRGKIVYDGEGKAIKVYAASIDISRRKRTEEALRKSNEDRERLEALMDNNPSLVFLKDEEGRYVYLNKAYEMNFVPAGDWYGKTDFDFWPKESAELFQANDASVLNSGQTTQFMEDSTDLNGQRYCWLNYKFPFTDTKNRRYLGGIGIDATRLVLAEEALRDRTRELEESNRQRTDILESISDCFYALDKDLRFTYVNKAAEEIWNLSRADLLGRSIEDVFEGLIDISLSKFHRALAEQTPQHYDVFSKVAQKWGDMSVYPTLDGISVYFHDITGRKLAEEALRESGEREAFLLRLNDVIRSLEDPDAIKEMTARMVGKQLGVDRAGYGEVIWKDDMECFQVKCDYHTPGMPELGGAVYPVAAYGPAVADTIHSGQMLAVSDVETDERFTSEEREAYRAVNIRAIVNVPLIREGRCVANFGLQQRSPRNWTPGELKLLEESVARTWAALERAKAEKALAAERKRLFDVLETLPVLICLITPDYHIPFSNKAFRDKFGEANERRCYDLCCGFSQPCAFCEALIPLETGKPHHWEFNSPDGSTVIDAYDFPFNDMDGSPLILEMDIDITDRRRAEAALRVSEAQARLLAEALEKKNRLVTDFFINISHEFKTPLTILMLGLELLETKARRMNGGEAFIGNLTAMKQNSYRLNRLVGNLLDITKLDAGFMQPKWEKADAAGLLRALAQSVEPYALQRQLSFGYACEPAEIPLMTDGFMLERIVLNLLSNAIKHTPAGGDIRLSCRAGKDGVSITVQDTGEGIPEDKKAMIFDRFSQVDTRMTRASEGTGIGLALVKSLAELLGGKVSLESELGRGSVFTVELPYVKRAATKAEAEQGNIQMEKRIQMELSDVMQ